MNKEVTPIDRETKILLLNVLKKGCFDNTDIEILSKKIVFNIPVQQWTINVIENNRKKITES
jgi:hypothetical protein